MHMANIWQHHNPEQQIANRQSQPIWDLSDWFSICYEHLLLSSFVRSLCFHAFCVCSCGSVVTNKSQLAHHHHHHQRKPCRRVGQLPAISTRTMFSVFFQFVHHNISKNKTFWYCIHFAMHRKYLTHFLSIPIKFYLMEIVSTATSSSCTNSVGIQRYIYLYGMARVVHHSLLCRFACRLWLICLHRLYKRKFCRHTQDSEKRWSYKIIYKLLTVTTADNVCNTPQKYTIFAMNVNVWMCYQIGTNGRATLKKKSRWKKLGLNVQLASCQSTVTCVCVYERASCRMHLIHIYCPHWLQYVEWIFDVSLRLLALSH